MERAKGGTIGTESQTHPETDANRKRPDWTSTRNRSLQFSFAISVVGTDTASALAVGCPVVVKAHPDHARTCQSLADLVVESLREWVCPGKKTFQLVHGIEHAVTRESS